MTKYNAKNERIKRDYFRWQKDSQGKADTTLNGIRKAISRFEEHTKFKDFGTFNKEQAIAFKKHMAAQTNQRSRQPVSKATVLTTL